LAHSVLWPRRSWDGVSADARETGGQARKASGSADTQEYAASLPVVASLFYWAVAADALGRARWRSRNIEHRRAAAILGADYINAIVLVCPQFKASLSLMAFGGAIECTVDSIGAKIDLRPFLTAWGTDMEIAGLAAWWQDMRFSEEARISHDAIDMPTLGHFIMGIFLYGSSATTPRLYFLGQSLLVVFSGTGRPTLFRGFTNQRSHRRSIEVRHCVKRRLVPTRQLNFIVCHTRLWVRDSHIAGMERGRFQDFADSFPFYSKFDALSKGCYKPCRCSLGLTDFSDFVGEDSHS
jgi:hypothetical protein